MTSEEALTTLQPTIAALARRIGKRHPRVDVRDLEQDAALAVVQALPRYDGSTQLSTFMGLRLHGSMIDGLRRWHPRRRRTHGSGIEWEALDAERTVGSARDPETLLQATELRYAVDRLPAREQFVLRAYYWDGKRLVEIARELGLGKSRVGQCKQQALARLRRRSG